MGKIIKHSLQQIWTTSSTLQQFLNILWRIQHNQFWNLKIIDFCLKNVQKSIIENSERFNTSKNYQMHLETRWKSKLLKTFIIVFSRLRKWSIAQILWPSGGRPPGRKKSHMARQTARWHSSDGWQSGRWPASGLRSPARMAPSRCESLSRAVRNMATKGLRQTPVLSEIH